MLNRLKQLIIFALLAALFVRGNASGFHYHVELCQEIAQEFCCEHDQAQLVKHCETPPEDDHGHCPHECRVDVSKAIGATGSLGVFAVKPILRSLGFVQQPSTFELKYRSLERFGVKDKRPPPQIHLVRDTVRLL